MCRTATKLDSQRDADAPAGAISLSIRVWSLAVTGKRRSERTKKRRRHAGSLPSHQAPGKGRGFDLAEGAERLVYTRKQAAKALGVSLATLDRRIVPALNTVKTPWGTRMIPVSELERFLVEHTQVASVEFSPRRRAGRRSSVPVQVVKRIQRDHAQGKSLAEIARGLTADGVATAHGGRQWWPSTVRAVLRRTVAAFLRPDSISHYRTDPKRQVD